MLDGMSMSMSSDEYEELYLASVRVPLVLAIFLGLWGLVILVLQALQIDFSSVLRKASGKSREAFGWEESRAGKERQRDRETRETPHAKHQTVFLQFAHSTAVHT